MTWIAIVLGMQFSMLYSTGLISLGCAAFYAVGAYASTLLVMKLGLTFWLALPLASIITGIIALGIGSMIVRHPGMAFVILTMIFSMVVVQVAGQIQLFGGWSGFMGISPPNSLGPIEFIGKTPYYYLGLFLLLLIVFVFYALYTSRIGRVWRAIRLSGPLAETLGINVYRYRLLAFVIASSAAGMVGSFYAHYFQTIAPEAFGAWSSIYIQLYAVLGGLGFYIVGPAIGAAIMTFVPEFLRVAREVEPIITGVVLLVIIILFPGGILGTLQRFPRLGLVNISARIEKIRRYILTKRT
jgi:branched-chain amino acid transport system permease protein